MRLRLYENYRFVLYTPFYAAHAIGAYAAEDLAVELLPSPGSGLAEEALLDGTVDVIWAGPMRVMKHHDTYPDSRLVCFAAVVCRDPFSIVGVRPNPDFRLADLASIRFATVSEVPTPWLCLRAYLRQVGVDPERLDRIADRGMADNIEALQEGRIEAAQLFEPFVEQALASGLGYLWHQASAHGRTTYTALVTTRERLTHDAQPLHRMTRAIYRTQRWLHARSADEIATAIASFFPTVEHGVLARAIARYQTQLVWGRDPVLPKGGFDRLQRCLVSSGLIRQPVDYEACVDNTLACRILAE
jgi:NitT/TauT family transport system substrate-binding protein